MVKQPSEFTPREAVEWYLDRRGTELTEQSLSSYWYRLKLFVEWCEEQDVERVEEFSGWLFDQYHTHRTGVGVAATTINAEMDTLVHLIEHLESVGAVEEDLSEKIYVPDIPDGEETNRDHLPAERARQLLKFYRNHDDRRGTGLHAILEITWHVGCRLSALQSLDMRDYDREKRWLHFEHRPETGTTLKKKAKGNRLASLTREVCDVLDDYIMYHRKEGHDEFGRQPFFVSSKRNRLGRNTIRTWMYKATWPCNAEPCPHGHNPRTCEFKTHSKASQCPSSKSPHAVRTGSMMWQRDNGVPKEVLKERANASERVIDQYYDHSEEVDKMLRRRRPHTDQLSLEPHAQDTKDDE